MKIRFKTTVFEDCEMWNGDGVEVTIVATYEPYCKGDAWTPPSGGQIIEVIDVITHGSSVLVKGNYITEMIFEAIEKEILDREWTNRAFDVNKLEEASMSVNLHHLTPSI